MTEETTNMTRTQTTDTATNSSWPAHNSAAPMRRISSADVIWSSHSLTPTNSVRALLFESRGMLFALAADCVSEVIDVPAIQPIPNAATWYEGVAVHRSLPVPVVDVAGYFNSDSPAPVFNRAIVVRAASSTYLIVVDKILNLCSLPADEPLPLLRNTPEYAEHRAIQRVCEYENRLLAVIDLPELLRCTKLLRECAFC